ncbi:hypothetical protein E2C01_013764 [Portunus trituberculatus]|uniref:Uncharacterized protein n=1 Tax=Portunus trituberculatus TaxID=210409 RepID=A0A5B7DI61_PORTR|nr:hypothetical protein [Portunus trituberculatus]
MGKGQCPQPQVGGCVGDTTQNILNAFMEAISRQKVALTLLKNLGSSSRSARDRGGEPANHSETNAFGPSPDKFKPRRCGVDDVITPAPLRWALMDDMSGYRICEIFLPYIESSPKKELFCEAQNEILHGTSKTK